MDDHAVADGGLAGGDELGDAFDFDQANAAGGDDRKARMIAVIRKINLAIETGLQDHLAVFGLDKSSINGDFRHKGWMIAEIVLNFTRG